MNIQTKFSRGDRIFTLSGQRIVNVEIGSILIRIGYEFLGGRESDKTEIIYNTNAGSGNPRLQVPEVYAFSTKEELIQSLDKA